MRTELNGNSLCFARRNRSQSPDYIETAIERKKVHFHISNMLAFIRNQQRFQLYPRLIRSQLTKFYLSKPNSNLTKVNRVLVSNQILHYSDGIHLDISPILLKQHLICLRSKIARDQPKGSVPSGQETVITFKFKPPEPDQFIVNINYFGIVTKIDEILRLVLMRSKESDNGWSKRQKLRLQEDLSSQVRQIL